MGEGLVGLGDIDAKQSDFAAARKNFKQARVLCEQIPDPSCEANTNYLDSHVLEALGQRPLAIDMLNRTIVLAIKGGNLDLAAKAKEERDRVSAEPKSQ